MKNYRAILVIGITEILIGGTALLGNFFSILLSLNSKSPNVLLFVIVAGSISTLIGVGILTFKKLAYQLLLYFSSVVIFSKILLFIGIIHFDGQLEISIHEALNISLPALFDHTVIALKDTASIIYHGFVIYYLRKPEIKEIFQI